MRRRDRAPVWRVHSEIHGRRSAVYFGYPKAHEHDAERAVRAGLELVAAVSALKASLSLQTRVGIATGLVVVGDLIGAGEAQVSRHAMIWHPYQELTSEEEKHVRMHFAKLWADEQFKASVNSCVKEIARRLTVGDNADADLFDEMRNKYGDDQFTVAINMFLHRGREAMSRPNRIGGILRLTSDGAPRARSEGSEEGSQT